MIFILLSAFYTAYQFGKASDGKKPSYNRLKGILALPISVLLAITVGFFLPYKHVEYTDYDSAVNAGLKTYNYDEYNGRLTLNFINGKGAIDKIDTEDVEIKPVGTDFIYHKYCRRFANDFEWLFGISIPFDSEVLEIPQDKLKDFMP